MYARLLPEPGTTTTKSCHTLTRTSALGMKWNNTTVRTSLKCRKATAGVLWIMNARNGYHKMADIIDSHTSRKTWGNDTTKNRFVSFGRRCLFWLGPTLGCKHNHKATRKIWESLFLHVTRFKIPAHFLNFLRLEGNGWSFKMHRGVFDFPA